MIGRAVSVFWRVIILIAAGVIIVTSASRIPAAYNFDPAKVKVSPEDLDASVRKGADYLRVDLSPTGSVTLCRDAPFDGGDSDLKVPTRFSVPLTRAQQAARGKGELIRANYVLSAPCSSELSRGFGGAVARDGLALEPSVVEAFRQLGVAVSPGATLIREEAPPSAWGEFAAVLFGIFLGGCALVSLLPGPPPLGAEAAERLTTAQLFAALHPVARLGETSDSSDSSERVLAVFNCRFPIRRGVAVCTTRRLLIYRYHGLWWMKGVSLLQQLLEKIPVAGGMLTKMLDPIVEAAERIFRTRERMYIRAMAVSDDRLLGSDVPWRLTTDIEWTTLLVELEAVRLPGGRFNRIVAIGRGLLGRASVPPIAFDEPEVKLGIDRLIADFRPVLAQQAVDLPDPATLGPRMLTFPPRADSA